MNKVIESRLKEINFNEIGARGVAVKICDVIIKHNLSLNEADVTLDLVKDMLANRPLNAKAIVIEELKQRNNDLLNEAVLNDEQIKANKAVIDMLGGSSNQIE